MTSCAYRNCRNSTNNCSLTFHHFPSKSNEELRKKWLLNCGLAVDFDCSGLLICSDHFEPRDFKYELMGPLTQTSMNDEAVPCVRIKNENIAEHDEEAYYPEYNPTCVLGQLADVALNDSYFNNLRNLDEAPVELIVPQQINNIPQQVNNIPQQVNNIPPQVITIPQQFNNVPQPVVSTTSSAPSSLPASQNWAGEYNFDVTFSSQEKATKSLTWTYSKLMDKIYVNKDAPCPVNFSTNTVMPQNVVIRAMALYSCPENASEIVARCSNHYSDEKKSGVFEAEHLIRCESPNAVYEVNRATKRHSVKVPFENPPVGQLYSTYLYKFTCFGSCPFGPNRRPLLLVFTLEQGDEVLGRRIFDLKICACPGRDRKTDEAQNMIAKEGITVKKKNNSDHVSLFETFEFTRNLAFPAPKKAKITNDQEEGKYTVKVNDYECYQFLLQMKTFYKFAMELKGIQKQLRNNTNQQPKSPESDV